ncbi:MAG: ATP-binding protein [Chloroflexota bacterium]
MPRFEAFEGRQRELTLMDRLWHSRDAAFLILYGRRRVGKTRLLKHWSQQPTEELGGKRVLYWVATPASASDQLRSFSQAVYNFANPQIIAPVDFSYATWSQAWQQVANLAKVERFALFVDEFDWVLAITPSIAGILQNAWDHILSQSNLFLVLSGSNLSMMQRYLLSYQAPLYGRASRQLHLQPIPFGNTRAFFPNFRADERTAIYAIFGGIPAYWERVELGQSILDNIREQLLTPDTLMQAEPRLLLQDFVNEPHNYVSLLGAIANGARLQKEISQRTGLAQGHVSKYLSVLREAGFIERRVPITANANSRLGRYYITDPYLRFYYRFLFSQQAQLAMEESEPVLAEIRHHLIDFVGSHTWQELCREWTLRAGVKGVLPFMPDQVGSAWAKTSQIDVVGINTMERTLLLGVCDWEVDLADCSLLRLLEARTAAIIPKQGRWRVFYLGFARVGWTAAAKAFAAETSMRNVQVGNWQVEGMKLLDLQRIDDDLAYWIAP